MGDDEGRGGSFRISANVQSVMGSLCLPSRVGAFGFRGSDSHGRGVPSF